MQIKRIKCPKCGEILEVKNSKNEEVKHINCPKCFVPLLVKFPPPQEPMEAKTYYTPKPSAADYGATQLGGISSSETQLALSPSKEESHASIFYGGMTYQLEDGQNIIGRKATSSTANIQIETADRYMSRQHCSITVSTLPDGTKKAVLSNYQNKNKTTVDGYEIKAGDEIRLTDGNSITMGYTTVTFNL